MNGEDSVSIERRRRRPDWPIKSLEECLQHFTQVDEVLTLSIHGVSNAKGAPGVVSALESWEKLANQEKFTEEVQEKFAEDLKRAEQISTLAQREINSGFSILYAHAIVSLWGSLETAIQDVVVAWICNKPAILSQEPWTGLKVKIGDYEPLDSEQRARFLASLVDQSMNGALKQGINRFEQLLATVGLVGSFPEAKRQNIFEFQQVRNLLSHRRGVADIRFCKACPWLTLTPGQRLTVSRPMYQTYRSAALDYLTEIMVRSAELLGEPLEGFRGGLEIQS